MTQVYNIISIVAFSLAGVFFFVSVFLWFKFNVWEIIGDLSGRNAKKSIKQMRQENEKSGVNLYRPSGSYGARGESGEISVRQNSTQTNTDEIKTGGMKTGGISTAGLKTARAIDSDEGSNATTLLSDSVVDDENATTILDSGATELLDDGATELLEDGATELLDDGATELLDDGATQLLDEGTTVLTSPAGDLQSAVNQAKLTIIQSIVLIHTDEEIA